MSTRSKKILTVLAISVIMVGLIVWMVNYYFDNRNQDELASQQQIVQITYTSGGFSPEHVRITPGTKVVWLNNDPSQSLRVIANAAEDGHAAPEFGATEAVGQDGTYEYVFGSAGSYSYHSAAIPLQGGLIEVVEE